jgi:hypothetical protein
MDRLERLEEFISAMDMALDFGEVFRVLGDQTCRLGFERFTYWMLWPDEGPRRPFCLTNYPAEWAQRYLDQGYGSHDMVGRHSALTVRPFSWKEISCLPYLTSTQRLIFHEGGEIGLKAGASVPIHGPGAAKAVFSVASAMPDQEFVKLFLAWRHEIQLIASYAHEHILKLGMLNIPTEAWPVNPRQARP